MVVTELRLAVEPPHELVNVAQKVDELIDDVRRVSFWLMKAIASLHASLKSFSDMYLPAASAAMSAIDCSERADTRRLPMSTRIAVKPKMMVKTSAANTAITVSLAPPKAA